MFPIRVTVPTRFPAAATYVLITLKVVVFLLQVSLPDQSQTALAFAYGLVPARYTHPEWASRVGLDTGDYLFPFSSVVVLPIIFIPLFFTLPAVIYITVWFMMRSCRVSVQA
jgi:rhomboid family protein